MRLALHQPDMPGNVGTILRLAACFGVPVDIIEPCGFPFSDRSLRRAGLDYAASAELTRHADWGCFRANCPGRIALLTTHAETNLYAAEFQPGDTLLLGSEGSGVPPAVHAAVDLKVRIPLLPGYRSLNVAVAAGIALAEALRQTGGLPN
jgi:tRNA (cytidine/uridine-2'-O-)-methyltransferase